MKHLYSVLLAVAMAAPSVAPAQEGQSNARRQQSAQTTMILVKGNLLSAVTGIVSAEASATALHEMARAEPFERDAARDVTELARQAVILARERAGALSKNRDVPPESVTDARGGVNMLNRAHTTVEEILRQAGAAAAGPFKRGEMDNMLDLTAALISELEQAKHSVKRVADRYSISMNLGAFSRYWQ